MEVSRSGYYSWRKRGKSTRERERDKLIPMVKAIHKRSRSTYCKRRSAVELQSEGISCGEYKAGTLMKLAGIQAKQKKNFKATINSKHNMPVFPNLLKRDFNVSQQNKVWVGDITYIWGTKVGSAQPDKSNKDIRMISIKKPFLFEFVIDELHIIVFVFGRIDGYNLPCFLFFKPFLKYYQLIALSPKSKEARMAFVPPNS